MTPKPLTKEQRNQLVAAQRKAVADGESVVWSDALSVLLADAAYWREAVKNCAGHPTDPDDCVFCGAADLEDHEPECPWLLAQEKA